MATTKKRKSTIQIPFGTDRNGVAFVPHWTQSKDFCAAQIRDFTSTLNAGFAALGVTANNWTEDNWKTWINHRIQENTFDWKDPEEFEDTFKVLGSARGRSAAYFNMESLTTGLNCVMMMTDMAHMVTTANISAGVITGIWIFGKRGANYGIQYVGEK